MRIPTAISRKVASTSLKAQKNAPSLLFGAGVAGMIGSTVLACRATLKLEEVLRDTQADLHVANNIEHKDYSEEDRAQDRVVIYSRSVITIAKLYGPAIVVGGISIACLTKSKNILEQRNEALMAAYVAIDSAFNGYRARVREKYGEEEDHNLRYPKEQVEEWDEGKGKMVEKTVVRDLDHSQYSRFFDEYSTQWEKDPEYNLVFLKCQQNYANDKLNARGHLFLNEVYEMLGLDHTEAGAVVGWLRVDRGGKDGFVDFGIFDSTEQARHFVNGREGSILLDFNVDGVIYNLIDAHKLEEGKKWQS